MRKLSIKVVALFAMMFLMMGAVGCLKVTIDAPTGDTEEKTTAKSDSTQNNKQETKEDKSGGSNITLTNVTIASEVDEMTYEPITKQDVFSPDSEVVYLVGNFSGAIAKETELTMHIIYLETGEYVGSASAIAGYSSGPFMFNITRPNNGFPVGKYQFTVTVGEEELEELAVAFFTVEGSENGETGNANSAAHAGNVELTDVAIASEIDPETLAPLTVQDVFSPDAEVVYLTGNYSGAIPNETVLTMEVVYLDENISLGTINSGARDSFGPFEFHVTKPDNGFPKGDYKFIIINEGKELTSAIFTVE